MAFFRSPPDAAHERRTADRPARTAQARAPLSTHLLPLDSHCCECSQPFVKRRRQVCQLQTRRIRHLTDGTTLPLSTVYPFRNGTQCVRRAAGALS